MSLFLRPDTDSSNSGWSDQSGGTTNLYAVVDEVTLDDADYIRSSANPTADVIRFRVSDPSGGLAEPFNVRYRYGLTASGALKITARLKQGSTVIKAWEHTDASTTFQTVTQTLSSGEFASISDFTDLFIEFEAGPAASVIAIRTASPNDLSHGSWSSYGHFVSNTNYRAPDNSSTATGLYCDTATNAGRNTAAIPDGGSSGVLVPGQHYSIRLYMTHFITDDSIGNIGSGWFHVHLYDGGSGLNQIAKWFHITNLAGAVGSDDVVGPGGGAIHSAAVTGVAHGYYQIDIELSIASGYASGVTLGVVFGEADLDQNISAWPQGLFFWGVGA